MTKIPKDDTKRMTEREILGIADIIGVLGDDFSNIYCVDCRTKNIEIYRYENKNVGVKEVLHEKSPYESAIHGYIEKNVYSDDKEKMKSATDFDNIYNQLKHVAQFTVHYRVKRNNEILYYRMKCARIGKADDFQKIIFAFASEDADVRLNELGVMMKSSGATGKRKILIVEDDELNLEMLEALLVDKYEILTAKNGRTGLKVLEEYYKELSLILLDVQMPVLNGFEFLKKVREDALISSVPIIVITANDSVDTELICLDLGAADFITKPYNADIIRRRIRNVIRLKESSMICLNQLPFSTLKIDKSLVDHICEPKGKTLVEQIIMLSKLLNMEVVAEGVENIEQIEELRKMKCDVIQGFYYAKPMSENEFIEYVKVNRLR